MLGETNNGTLGSWQKVSTRNAPQMGAPNGEGPKETKLPPGPAYCTVKLMRLHHFHPNTTTWGMSPSSEVSVSKITFM